MKGTRRFAWSAALVAVVVVGLLIVVFAAGWKPKLGLDLSGGLSVTLSAPAHTPGDKVDEAVNILRNRVDALGVSNADVTREGNINILVEIPNVKDPNGVLKILGQTAQLEFRQVQQVITNGAPGYSTLTVTPDDQRFTTATVVDYGIGQDSKTKYQLATATLTGEAISGANAQVNTSNGAWLVNLTFKSNFQSTWTKFTSNLACITNTSSPTRQIGIVLDNRVQSAPVVQTDVACGTGIPGGTQIQGSFTQSDAKNLALVLQSGALPVKLTQQTEQLVSATLGAQSLRAGLLAGALGLFLVMIYVAIYYRALGLQTWVGLIAFSALTYGVIVLLGQVAGLTLSLAGIAGLIVSIGITTDSYVVFFERVKEEVHEAKTLRSSVDRGYKSAVRTLFTADTVTFFAALILYILAIGSVRGFALTLGLATALDVALFLALTYPLAAILARTQVFGKGRFIGMTTALEGTGSKGLLRKIYRSDFHIDFIRRRGLWLGISGVIIAISIVALIPGVRGLHYGIDFKGGTQFIVPLTKDVSVPDIKAAVAKQGVVADTVQIAHKVGQSAKQAEVETISLNPTKTGAVQQALASLTATPVNKVSVDSVGSTWGHEITNKAIRGLIVFLIVVILYMSWRLETKMAFSGIIALLHDLVITAGIYALTGLQVTPDTVIAILTILGYSLYDTVVVFDKIKENVVIPSNAKKPYATIANESMNQVLMRSINTSLTTLLPVGSLLFVGSFLLGADTLRELALALFVGIASGTYSSIFVATPLLSIMKEREPRYASLRSAAARAPRLAGATAGGGTVALGGEPDEDKPARRPAGKAPARPATKSGGGRGEPGSGEEDDGEKPAPKPAAKPAAKPGARPAPRAGTRPVAKPGAKAAPKPAAQETTKPAGEANGEPAPASASSANGSSGADRSTADAGNGRPPARPGGGTPASRPQPRKTNRAKRKKGGR
ncbi:MAG TPA: protein translocase subunit SecF [Actinomycetota bacterium]|nr:protein translocase subunit SecF [Actinomycetota bacterium]